MRRTCLVTGGAGFIGCAISLGLIQRFDEVIALDNLHPQVHRDPVRPAALDERVVFVRGDVAEERDWEALLSRYRPNTIIHLAAETGTGQSLTEGSRHANVNVVGTTRMLDALSRRGIAPERVVLTSSRAVYGEGAWRDNLGRIRYPGQRSRSQLERGEWDFPGLSFIPFDAAETEPRPASTYGATKLAQEHILSSWCLSFGVNCTILRLQNVYGPGQSLTNPYTGIVPFFVQVAQEGKSIPVYEDGEIVRDFVFVDDAADAIVRAATQAATSRTPYDIGTGRATTIHELARFVAALYGAPPPHVNGAYRNGDVRRAVCRPARALSELGWSASMALEPGIMLLCQWIDRENQLKRAIPID